MPKGGLATAGGEPRGLPAVHLVAERPDGGIPGEELVVDGLADPELAGLQDAQKSEPLGQRHELVSSSDGGLPRPQKDVHGLAREARQGRTPMGAHTYPIPRSSRDAWRKSDKPHQAVRTGEITHTNLPAGSRVVAIV